MRFPFAILEQIAVLCLELHEIGFQITKLLAQSLCLLALVDTLGKPISADLVIWLSKRDAELERLKCFVLSDLA